MPHKRKTKWTKINLATFGKPLLNFRSTIYLLFYHLSQPILFPAEYYPLGAEIPFLCFLLGHGYGYL